ncbi:voltage-gated potassium channel [Aureococcus anophagefferens]|nr:voltage-gated potassium channel [Aureococcus anophagefferens]
MAAVAAATSDGDAGGPAGRMSIGNLGGMRVAVGPEHEDSWTSGQTMMDEMPGRPSMGRGYVMEGNAGKSLFEPSKYAMHDDAAQKTLVDEVDAVRKRLRESDGWIIDPHSRFIQRWDGVTFAALLFTAVVTPVEVAFSGSVSLKNTHEIPLFALNRIVDSVFITDFVLQFFMGFEDMHGLVVKSHRRIAVRYLTGWAIIDFVSSLPLETIMLVIAAAKGGGPSGGGSGGQFVKILRLLRLLKLARVIRASRILARWEAAAVFAFTYTEISMYKFFFTLVLYAHWNACIWGMVAHPDIAGFGSGYTWMDKLSETQSRVVGHRCSYDAEGYYGEAVGARGDASACEAIYDYYFDKTIVRHKYCASLYFAVYTMAGIGFGDISATGHIEVIVATAIMLCGAVFWAYMIGQFVTLRMDELNFMMADKKFPTNLKRRCRMFLLHSKEHQRQVNYRQLEKIMSISLRDEVAAANNAWVRQVWYLREVTPPFVVDLSQAIQSLVYAPTEVIDLGLSLFIITNGIAAHKGRIISKDGVWGEDFMLDNVDLIDMICTAALSYLEVICLSREKMIKILATPMHEAERKIIRMAVVFYTVKARFLQIGADAITKRLRAEWRSGVGGEPADMSGATPDRTSFGLEDGALPGSNVTDLAGSLHSLARASRAEAKHRDKQQAKSDDALRDLAAKLDALLARAPLSSARGLEPISPGSPADGDSAVAPEDADDRKHGQARHIQVAGQRGRRARGGSGLAHPDLPARGRALTTRLGPRRDAASGPYAPASKMRAAAPPKKTGGT